MRKSVARPLKYARIIAALEDGGIYTPASIAILARDQGLLAPFLEKEPNEALVLQRIRISMNRLRRICGFPAGGDDQLIIPGQRPVRVWFGWRWKINLE